MKRHIAFLSAAILFLCSSAVTAFADDTPNYKVEVDRISDGEVVLVGENGIYSSADELAKLTSITLTITVDPSAVNAAGSFVIEAGSTQTYSCWSLEESADIVFTEIAEDSNIYTANVTGISIPSGSTSVKIKFLQEGGNDVSLTGVTLNGAGKPKEVVVDPASSEASSQEDTLSSESSSSNKPADSSNKPTGAGVGLVLAGTALAAAMIVSSKKK